MLGRNSDKKPLACSVLVLLVCPRPCRACSTTHKQVCVPYYLDAIKSRCDLLMASHSTLTSTVAFAEFVVREHCSVMALLLEGNLYVHTIYYVQSKCNVLKPSSLHFAYLCA